MGKQKQTFYLTFGVGHPLCGYYVVIKCKDYDEAWKIAKIQFERYGEIYNQDQWSEFLNRFGETYDVHYKKKLAAVIDDYKYAEYYVQKGEI